jgi:hypothetical protein
MGGKGKANNTFNSLNQEKGGMPSCLIDYLPRFSFLF